jgi:hypothetical protein
MAILPRSIYRYDAMPVKFLSFFAEKKNPMLKFI